MDKVKTQKYCTRWTGLTQQTRQTDYDKAALFYEIREEFPIGSPGDSDFRNWVRDNLHAVTLTQQVKMLSMAKGYSRFNRDLWMRGGWDSVRYMLGFKESDAKRVLVAAMGKRRTALRKAAAVVKVRSRTLIGVNGVGRPTRDESYAKLRLLRSWLRHIYSEYDLPSMPADVKMALGSGSPLEKIETASMVP